MMYVYHASTAQSLATLEPSRSHVRDRRDPARVYASPDKQVAAAFFSRRCEFGSWHDGPWTLVIDEAERVRLETVPGSIYTVKAEPFTYTTDAGLKEAEWFCECAVPVVEEELWHAAFDALRHYGVCVCVLYDNDVEEFAQLETPVQGRLVRQAVQRPDGTFRISFMRVDARTAH